MPPNLDHVYTDRARVQKRVEGARVEFETQIYEEYSEWFPCRIAVAFQNNQERYAGTHREIEHTHQFICRLTDFLGGPVELHAGDCIEVETGPSPYSRTSQDAGVYEITELPFKPRDIVPEEILWVVQLKKLFEF